jgi:hypothetical protein
MPLHGTSGVDGTVRGGAIGRRVDVQHHASMHMAPSRSIESISSVASTLSRTTSRPSRSTIPLHRLSTTHHHRLCLSPSPFGLSLSFDTHFEFATASSPMKKSRSSIPLLLARWLGLPATGGGALPPDEAAEAEPDEADWWVAMTVGNTKEGSELPAKLRVERQLRLMDGGLRAGADKSVRRQEGKDGYEGGSECRGDGCGRG